MMQPQTSVPHEVATVILHNTAIVSDTTPNSPIENSKPPKVLAEADETSLESQQPSRAGNRVI